MSFDDWKATYVRFTPEERAQLIRVARKAATQSLLAIEYIDGEPVLTDVLHSDNVDLDD